MSIRFHLDEHVSNSIAAGLRSRGINVSTALEAGLASADYLRLHNEGVVHEGIAYCHQGTLSIGEMIRSPLLIHDVLTQEEMTGRIEYL